jgi:hypothetical protein
VHDDAEPAGRHVEAPVIHAADGDGRPDPQVTDRLLMHHAVI